MKPKAVADLVWALAKMGVKSDAASAHSVWMPLPSEKGTTQHVLRTCTCKQNLALTV